MRAPTLDSWRARLDAHALHHRIQTRAPALFKHRSFPDIMNPSRPEIQEAFLRAGAEMDAWRYTWRVRARTHRCSCWFVRGCELRVARRD